MEIKGFKEIDYNGLQDEIKKVYNPDVVSFIQVAAQINVRSVQTIRNAFMPDAQGVSDEVFTNILTAIGLDAFIIWKNGQRSYYIKK